MTTTLTFVLSLSVSLLQGQAATPPDVSGTWQEMQGTSGGTVTVSRLGAGVVAIAGTGTQDGSYGFGGANVTRRVIGCIDWTYERLASVTAPDKISLRETRTRRPGCPHGGLTVPVDENGSGLPFGATSRDVTAVTQTEILLSVSDGVLTVETRTIGPNGPVTVSTKKYRRQ